VPAPRAPAKKKAPVAAIAAVAVVLVGAGGFAAMKMIGGDGTTPNDTTTVRTDSVIDTIAQPGNGGRPQPGGGQTPGGQQTQSGGGGTQLGDSQPRGGGPPTGGGESAATAVVVAAIRTELGTLLDRVLDGASPDHLVRLDAIRKDTSLPTDLRAEAARTAAQAYYDLDAGAGGVNLTRACDQLREARRLEPGNTTAQTMFTRYGCS
jgi:hypothetical protein